MEARSTTSILFRSLAERRIRQKQGGPPRRPLTAWAFSWRGRDFARDEPSFIEGPMVAPSIFFFADQATTAPQTGIPGDDGFGPVVGNRTTQFRVTSLHHAVTSKPHPA